MKYNQEALDVMLAAPKWLVEKGTYLDVFPLGNSTPLHHRLNLQDENGDNRFLWEISQSDTCEPLLRIDYQSGHWNPVEGYKSLAWAIPLADHEFPVKALKPTAELGTEIVQVITEFAKLIQLQTRIHMQPMLVV